MTATVVRALAVAAAVVLAFTIGHSATSATATLAAPPECRVDVDPAPMTPTDPIPLSRGHLVVV